MTGSQNIFIGHNAGHNVHNSGNSGLTVIAGRYKKQPIIPNPIDKAIQAQGGTKNATEDFWESLGRKD
ncbi:MAG TPA: hypothetical protein ENI23_14935 [bacterium]|nr:hypothetical protein [bacterium]